MVQNQGQIVYAPDGTHVGRWAGGYNNPGERINNPNNPTYNFYLGDALPTNYFWKAPYENQTTFIMHATYDNPFYHDANGTGSMDGSEHGTGTPAGVTWPPYIPTVWGGL